MTIAEEIKLSDTESLVTVRDRQAFCVFNGSANKMFTLRFLFLHQFNKFTRRCTKNFPFPVNNPHRTRERSIQKFQCH